MKRMMVCALLAALSCDATGDADVFGHGGAGVVDTGSGGGEGMDGGGPGADGAGPVDVGPAPAFEDDQALAAWMRQVADACPQVSTLTVPGGWAMSMIEEHGCVVYTPSWQAIPSPGIWQWVADDTRLVGFLVVAGSLPGVGWDEVSLAEQVVQGFADVHPDLAVIEAASSDDPYGTGWRLRQLLLRFTNDGTPSVAALRLVHGGCSAVLGTCPVTADVLWTTVAAYRDTACTLLQVEASFHCPSKGEEECDEGACDAGCKESGAAGGVCIGPNCVCT